MARVVWKPASAFAPCKNLLRFDVSRAIGFAHDELLSLSVNYPHLTHLDILSYMSRNDGSDLDFCSAGTFPATLVSLSLTNPPISMDNVAHVEKLVHLTSLHFRNVLRSIRDDAILLERLDSWNPASPRRDKIVSG